jgi:hypothetical protein
MLEEKYEIKSRLKICPSCQSFDVNTGKIFVPKKYDNINLECTNPECNDVFCIIPMFEFSFCCPDCGFECPVEDEAYQVLDDGSWNIFPWEILKYDNKDIMNQPENINQSTNFTSQMLNSILSNLELKKVDLEPMPEWLESCNLPIDNKRIYPHIESEWVGYEGDRNWEEIHYCPHCKKEYSFWNGN